VHNFNKNIKKWNDYFIMDVNFFLIQMWSKKIVTSDQKQFMIFKTLNIIAQRHESNYI
jgi:hypothetical protein